MHDLLDFLGIKAPVLIAGLSGGILRALSRHRYKLREMFASAAPGRRAACERDQQPPAEADAEDADKGARKKAT
ncbi:MAG: hypothetical protein E5X11_20315, partial [Mesorhizobium sp.]